MRSFFKQSPYLSSITLAFIVMSIIADVISFPIGLALGREGYILKFNWSLYPLYFLILGIIVHSSWVLYIQAWRSLPKNHVLYRGDVIEHDESYLDPFIRQLQSQRFYLVLGAIILGMALTAIDAGALWFEFDVFNGTLISQDTDFTVAYRLPAIFSNVDKTSNGLFNLYVYFLQGCLISYGWLLLMQITLHGIKFWRFERLNYAKQEKLCIRLNISDPLREFGLAEVNRAVNSVYISIAFGMLIPIVSAVSQKSNVPDLGQWLLRSLLPLILLAPLFIPLADRSSRLKEATNRLLDSTDEEKSKIFREQKLWPFEGTQIGYLGKAAAAFAAVEYLFLFTRNILDLIKYF